MLYVGFLIAADGVVSEDEKKRYARLQKIIEPTARDQKASPVKSTRQEEPETLESVLAELDSLIGLKAVKAEIQKLVSFLKVQKLRKENGLPTPPISLHMVFTEPPALARPPWQGY